MAIQVAPTTITEEEFGKLDLWPSQQNIQARCAAFGGTGKSKLETVERKTTILTKK